MYSQDRVYVAHSQNYSNNRIAPSRSGLVSVLLPFPCVTLLLMVHAFEAVEADGPCFGRG